MKTHKTPIDLYIVCGGLILGGIFLCSLIEKYAPKLEMGEKRKINRICRDSKGNQHLDVGLISKLAYVTSFETGEELPEGNKIHWCHPSRFKLV